MPIYEYECEKCHHKFELVQSFNAATTAPCEQCSGKARRLISPSSIVFKGSGFHVTDYSRSPQKADRGSGKVTKNSAKPASETPSKKPESPNAKPSSEKPSSPAPSTTAPKPEPPRRIDQT